MKQVVRSVSHIVPHTNLHVIFMTYKKGTVPHTPETPVNQFEESDGGFTDNASLSNDRSLAHGNTALRPRSPLSLQQHPPEAACSIATLGSFLALLQREIRDEQLHRRQSAPIDNTTPFLPTAARP